jgi:hypothetical protein
MYAAYFRYSFDRLRVAPKIWHHLVQKRPLLPVYLQQRKTMSNLYGQQG